MSKKGKRRKMKNSQVKVGEIIEIKTMLGMPASGIYRVEAQEGELIILSAGEIEIGVNKDYIEIVRRNLSEPETWSSREIEILETTACECEECLKLLAQKKGLIANSDISKYVFQ